MIVDGMAFVLVGVGLTATTIGYERNLPALVEQQGAKVGSDWENPVTTGAITPKVKEVAAGKTASQSEAKVEVAKQPAAQGTRVWSDPPRR